MTRKSCAECLRKFQRRCMSRPIYSEEVYNELVHIIRILKEGLEEIASDDSSEGETALEILQAMEDQCNQSNLIDIIILPTRLNT